MGIYDVRKTFCQRTQRLTLGVYRADQLAAHGELLYNDARLIVGPSLLEGCEDAPSEVWFAAIRVATELRLAELTVGYTTLTNVWGGRAQAILGSALQPLWDAKVGARLVLTRLRYCMGVHPDATNTQRGFRSPSTLPGNPRHRLESPVRPVET
jgi:hypothetical protein